jgi:hypothetical protein
MMRRLLFLAVAGAVGLACRGRPPGATPRSSDLRALVDTLIPAVERATGLKFTHPPKFAVRTKAEVERYLVTQLNQQFPKGKVSGIEMAYKLLDLVPDTTNVRDLLLPLYSEQVAGYYDPDSLTLYAVEGAKPDQLRLVLAHELVHALQHEQLPLEKLLKDTGDSDRLAAEQAVLEGHATVAMLGVILPDQSAIRDPDFWRQYREQIHNAQASMPIFNRAPVVLQESLIFPYLAGAEFMRWWESEGKPPLPKLSELPHSTEQILHPDRYQRGDQPLTVRFTDSTGTILHEDTMGELELQIWSAAVKGGGEVQNDLALGWGGDRIRLYETPAGPALVLYTFWDDSVSARGFASGPAARFVARPKPGYRTTAESIDRDGRFAVRVVRAPTQWERWSTLPTAAVLP